jgi:hypothetical protein
MVSLASASRKTGTVVRVRSTTPRSTSLCSAERTSSTGGSRPLSRRSCSVATTLCGSASGPGRASRIAACSSVASTIREPSSGSSPATTASALAVLVAVVVVVEFGLEILVNLAAGVHPPPLLEFCVLGGLELHHVGETGSRLLGEGHRLPVTAKDILRLWTRFVWPCPTGRLSRIVTASIAETTTPHRCLECGLLE